MGWQMADGRWQRRAAALVAALAAFAVTWLVLTAGHRPAPPLSAGDDGGVVRSNASTDEKIRLLRAQVADGVGGVDTRALLADAYLQKVRETGAIAFYAKARYVLRGV